MYKAPLPEMCIVGAGVGEKDLRSVTIQQIMTEDIMALMIYSIIQLEIINNVNLTLKSPTTNV